MKRFILPIFTGGFLVMFSLVIMVLQTMGAGEEDGYVGSETCSLCHRDIAERWQETPHANYVREATPESVVGDFTQATRKVVSHPWS
ncbi:TPA: hypothetical protein EYP66_01485 [Candidatus Poribacteria bacterium]|nr:hypothetical protein [Candidatus Poribacteria bacterium]